MGSRCLLLCQCPLTHAPALSLPPIPYSLGYNYIRVEGASALAAVLNETEITHLRCAAAPECSLSCQCPLTRLLSHYPHPTPRSQSRRQLHRRPGCLRACCRPQGDEDHQSLVRRHPRVFTVLSAPIDTLATLSPSPLLPSSAVSGTTRSEIKAPPRSPPSSRRRRSPIWSAPPPECLLLCQCPLTRACCFTAPNHTPCSLMRNVIGDEGASALAAILKETKIKHL